MRKAGDERILVTRTWVMTRKEMKTLTDTAMHGLCETALFPKTIDMAATCQEKKSLLLPTQAI